MSYLDRFHFSISNPPPSGVTRKLVFLHGVMGFASNWRKVAKEFESDFQVLLYDQRGHGRSFHPAGYAPDDYAADLERIIDELGWEKIHLVGHSMGGRVAFHFASFYPQRVEKLVLEDIGPVLQPSRVALIVRILDAVPVPFATRQAAKDYFQNVFPKAFADQHRPEDLAAFLYANIVDRDDRTCSWRFSEVGIRESVALGREQEHWDRLANLKVPTLVVRGELSFDLTKEVYEKMLSTNSLLEGRVVSGVGHWIHAEKPEEFVRILKSFLLPQAEA